MVAETSYFNCSLKDGLGMRNTKEFLDALFSGFQTKSEKFYNIVGDIPYAYREQQLHSILIPVIDQLDGTDAIFVEQPTTRVKSSGESNNSHGWIDYWVSYGETVFLIELKHSYCGYSSPKLRDSSVKEWLTAIEQIKVIDKKQLYDSKKTKSHIKIALNFIITYTASNLEENKLSECEEIGKKIYQTIESLSTKELINTTRGKSLPIILPSNIKPDIVAGWSVPKDMYIDKITMYEECYPYVHMIAKVESL